THCYHNMHEKNKACYHTGPCPVKCCRCGQSPGAEHGPFYPDPALVPPVVFSGWTCSFCGVWVPSGASHACMGWQNPPVIPWGNTYRCNAAAAFPDMEIEVWNP